MPCHRSRSSCQFSIPKSSLVFCQVVFHSWNLTSHTSFTLLFSSTVPLSHRCSYQMASWPTNSCYFAQGTTRIIIAWLCLVRYSLFASLVHPATKCSTISECWVHILQLQLSVSPLTFLHNLVSTICSNIVIIPAAFSGLRFWDNHKWHSCSCSLYNLLCCFYVLYSSTLWFFTPFLNFSFNLFHAGFHPPSISSPYIWMLSSSNWISTPTSSIVFIASSTIECSSLVFSLHAVLIHLFFEQVV